MKNIYSAVKINAYISSIARVPTSTWSKLIGAWSIVSLFVLFGNDWLATPLTPITASSIFILLFITILTTSFGVVSEADQLAHQLGEPYGTLILTISIVALEVILIASVLLGPGDFPTIGRDSIFAVMMIILNLIIGLCVVVGSTYHGEQEFNVQGAIAYLSMIVALTSVALVLPLYTSGAGEFSKTQAIGLSLLIIVTYSIFLSMQLRSHRHYFIQPPTQSIIMRKGKLLAIEKSVTASSNTTHTSQTLIVRFGILSLLLFPIVWLSHSLAIVIDYGIAITGAPTTVSGVLVAIIVFTPESITAIKAARQNQMQRAINLCLGAFVSTIGLTVPVILIIGVITGKQVIMGISNIETILLVITLALSLLTFNAQRTSALQGYLHLMLFSVFGFLLFFP